MRVVKDLLVLVGYLRAGSVTAGRKAAGSQELNVVLDETPKEVQDRAVIARSEATRQSEVQPLTRLPFRPRRIAMTMT